jgi:hypothetical protein
LDIKYKLKRSIDIQSIYTVSAAIMSEFFKNLIDESLGAVGVELA